MEDTAEEQILARLRRIEGQVKGLQRMVGERRPCEDVLTQVLAARAALDKVALEIIQTHVEQCLTTLPPERARIAISRMVELLTKIT